jgi:LPXTG-motif cell wall-anchored protein
MHCVADQLHAGMDFIADRGSPVLIPVDGTVALKSEDSGPGYNRAMRGYGNSVVIRVDQPVPGLPTPFFYSVNHLNVPSPLVVGQRVTAGMQAGVVGNTTNGQFRTMPPHLHFEVRTRPFPGSYDRDTIDPAVLWEGLGIDWLNHSLVGGRQSGGQLLVRRGGPSDCSATTRRPVSGLALFGLYGLGTDVTHVDPASPEIKGKYASKGTSTKSMDENGPEAEPPDYQEVVPQSSGSNMPLIAGAVAVVLLGGLYLYKRKQKRSMDGLSAYEREARMYEAKAKAKYTEHPIPYNEPVVFSLQKKRGWFDKAQGAKFSDLGRPCDEKEARAEKWRDLMYKDVPESQWPQWDAALAAAKASYEEASDDCWQLFDQEVQSKRRKRR